MPPLIIGAGHLTSYKARAAVAAAASLNGLQWLLPNQGDADAFYCTCPSGATVTATMGGTVGYAYLVTLRFRGVVEAKQYTGGSNVGYFQTGGTPAAGGGNIYKLHISDPDQTYYLNFNASTAIALYVLDYSETLTINGGATVTLEANSVDSFETRNNLPSSVINGGASAPGIISPAQPYSGQFIQMDVTNIL